MIITSLWQQELATRRQRLCTAALLDLAHNVAGLDGQSFVAATEEQLRSIIIEWRNAARAAIAKAEGAS